MTAGLQRSTRVVRAVRLARVVRIFCCWFVAVGGAPGCHHEPGPGDECKPTDIRCVDPHTELACQKGTFIPVPCKGPAGCKEDGKHLACDVSANVEGDACSTDEEGSAVCMGNDRRIICRGGKQTIDLCRGDKGCKSEASIIRCDQSKGEPDDPCSGQTHACSTDGKAVLACHDGKLAQVATCPGEGGCSIAQGKVDCDLGMKGDDKKTKAVTNKGGP